MLEISRFFGIVVQMFYGGREVEVAIETRKIMKGRISPRAFALVAEWAALHVEELRADWELAKASQPLSKIAPLR